MFDEAAPFGHLEPGQTSGTLLIAPASAAILSRLAFGQADHLLACQALAHKGKLIIAPAMNPAMWEHAATQSNVKILQERGAHFVMPGLGGTACGDIGQGRLADVRSIVLHSLRSLFPQDLKGKRVMLTIGATRELWDALRFWTNPSTGTMGAALALAAWLRGATVDAICAPNVPLLLDDIDLVRHDVVSAKDMYEKALSLWDNADLAIFTAAVADFAPKPCSVDGKFKKSASPQGFSVDFEPTVDIAHSLASKKKASQYVIAFAAESENLEQAVKEKLRTKNADMIVGNLLQHGFATMDNSVYIEDIKGNSAKWEAQSKAEIAMQIVEWYASWHTFEEQPLKNQ